MDTLTILISIGAVVLGLVGGIFVQKRLAEASKDNAESQGKKFIEDALSEAERIKKEAILKSKDEAYQHKQEVDKEIKQRSVEIKKEERRFSQKLEQIEKKIDLLDKRETDFLSKEKSFAKQENKLHKRKQEADVLIDEQRTKLENIAGISREEAQKRLVDSIANEAKLAAAKEIVKIENEMKIKADRKAKNILALAMSRYAGEYVAEKTVSIVPLPNEEMKGRIIGREGRNIRAIEAATGIFIGLVITGLIVL